MRKLAIAAAVSMSLATLSVNTHALGLGEIEMYSALNQTLDAEISIVSFAPGELEGLNVRLASAAAFASAGLVRSSVLSQMQFNVEQRPDGVPVVKISSDTPIVEPFLSFLLELDSPQGSTIVREYTVLLDPPLFVARQSELAEPTPAVAVADTSGVGVSSPINRDAAVVDGVVVDLASEIESTDAGSTIEPLPMATVYDEQADVAIIDVNVITETDTTADDVSTETLSTLQNVDNGVQVGSLPTVGDGTQIDLSAELLGSDSTAGNTVDNSTNEDSNAIFTDETANVVDQEENIVNLDSLVADNNSTVRSGDGQAVNLNVLVAENNAADSIIEPPEADTTTAEVDLSNVVVEPEVTLETVETRTVPRAATSLASADNALGEAIDISGIVPGDISSILAPSATDATPSAPVVSAGGYLVKTNDTLWSIARTQKAAGVTTRQMVVALLEANPDAFIDGDMNRMRKGATLQIPAELGGVSNADAEAIVRQQAPDTAAPVQTDEGKTEGLTIVAVDESANGSGTSATDDQSGASDLDRNLDAVNKKMVLAQEELTSESLQRDELSSRVVELEDSLAKMKKLITLRESELGNLQTELSTAKTDGSQMAQEAEEKARQLELAQSEKADMQADLKRLQDSIAEDASIAQEKVAAQADVDKNIASAEAEAQSIRLASEEDALKSQLAQLKVEKEELQKTAQNDKLALLKQSEAEKARLLENAKAERESIKAELEAEKARITEAAAAERLRIAEQAQLEKEQLIATANAERDRLAAESAAMRAKLTALEEEKASLLAAAEADKAELAEVSKTAAEEQSRLQAAAEAEKLKFEEESSRVKDRLAALQAEASANLAQNTEVVAAVTEPDTNVPATVAGNAEETGLMQDLGKGGAAAAGGLLAIAPLQKVMGDRKNILAAGGGLALLGLIGAWATRRRKVPVRDVPVDIDTSADLGKPARTHFDKRTSTYVENEQPRSTMGQAAVAASAAAAATGVAVARDEAAPAPSQPAARSAPEDQKEVSADAALPDQADSALDETITEADVYLRYGLHGQAEDLLQTAIERAPDNEQYHLKLLENYHDQENAAGFKAAAANYQSRFGNSANWEHVANMGRDLDAGDGQFSGAGNSGAGAGVASGVAAAGAVAAGAVGLSNDAGSNTDDAADLNQTIDAGAEFNLNDLGATGDFSGDDTFGIGDLDDVSLDEVDLAALDDDGTLNLEEMAGSQMSGLDLGSLDLTNPDGDSTLDNLTLDDADLNALGDITGSVPAGMDSDLELSSSYGADSNEMETMLDLAKAYLDMGDSESAANTLKDVVSGGNPAQQKEASDLLKSLT